MATTLEEVAAELYALPLEEFTPRRTSLAKQLREDDRELAEAVGRLPKPALSAWAVDRFARERPEDLGDLLALGEALREAQEERDADRVKSLTSNAQALVRRTLRGVADVAAQGGTPLSDTLLGQVEQTLRAAMADEEAACAVRAAVLAKPLAPAGFGPVDLSGAVAVIPATPRNQERVRRLAVVRPTRQERPKDDRGAAVRREAEEALARCERAAVELAQSQTALRAAEHDHEEVVRHKLELRTELAGAEREEQVTARRVREARKTHEQAARQAARAGEVAERAKKAVDALG
ncbi:MAG TPA: hypothetical protein VM097_07235 [Mycobacteriales bacterium]|nr:hypothetical protein [Mycobacteriales bacterium]